MVSEFFFHVLVSTDVVFCYCFSFCLTVLQQFVTMARAWETTMEGREAPRQVIPVHNGEKCSAPSWDSGVAKRLRKYLTMTVVRGPLPTQTLPKLDTNTALPPHNGGTAPAGHTPIYLQGSPRHETHLLRGVPHSKCEGQEARQDVYRAGQVRDGHLSPVSSPRPL